MPHELKSPGEIREHILRDHVRLRALLQDIRMLTHSAEKDSAVSDTLRHSLMEFIEVFFRHLESEESLLPDVVEGADSWGPERLAHMSEEHSAQRAALRELSYRAQKEPPQALAADANALVDTILRDMSAEERDLLGEDVLRDDFVAIETTSSTSLGSTSPASAAPTSTAGRATACPTAASISTTSSSSSDTTRAAAEPPEPRRPTDLR